MTHDLLREANPVPYEDSLPTGLWDSTALLDIIDERNEWMDSKQLTRPPGPDTKKRGWPIALVAAAAVALVVVATVMMTGSGDGGLAPATDDTPVTVTTIESTPSTEASAPTTQAPRTDTTVAASPSAELSAQDQELVEGFVSAFNSYNEAGLASFFSSDATIENNLSGNTDLAGFVSELPWRWAMNEQWEIVRCQQLSAIVCTLTEENDAISFQFGAVTTAVRIVAVGGEIVELVMNESMATIEPTLLPFYDWVEANRPGALRQMRVPGGSPGSPRVDQPSIELWLELLPIYKAEAGF